MLTEFKNFILKGNVIDLATGVIIGASFGAIVTAFTKGIVEPLLSLATGGKGNVQLMAGPFNLGIIISAILSFLITAAIIFFVIVKPVNKLMAMMKKQEAATPAAPPADIALLTEIRDLLKR